MLQESARSFLRSRVPVSHLRALRDSGEPRPFLADTWQEMSAMGWPAIAIPEAHGGLGFGYTGLGIILQEAGRTLAPQPLLSSSMMAVAALLHGGNEDQKADLLPALASGSHLASLAFDEGGQHQPAQVSTRASRTSNGFVINGRKRFVLDGTAADTLVVSARTGGKPRDAAGISLFLLPANTAGVSVGPCQVLDTCWVADVQLDEVRLPESALLGAEHQAYATLEHALDAGRIGQSAELLGVALESFERSLAYLKERKQFGVPIGSFQALQHRAAALLAELEMCKSLVLNALHQLDAGVASLGETASMTKTKLAETAARATAEAIQWHGGIGMTDAFDIGFFFKRARILEALLGDRYFHLERFARLRGY